MKGDEPVAYVYSAPTYVQFGFFRGHALKDPKKLLEGSGKYVRHIKVHSKSDIDERAFGTLLKQAARRRTLGIVVALIAAAILMPFAGTGALCRGKRASRQLLPPSGH